MKASDPRVGIAGFLLFTLLVLVAIVVISRYPSIFRTGREYRAIFHNVAGLNVGDEVRYGGLVVGAVTDMQIDPAHPTQIVVRFRVRRSTPIHIDTRASISQVGLLGQPFLQLQPGTPAAPQLAQGGTLPSEDSPTFQDAMARLASFFDRADTLLNGAERLTRGSPLDRLDRTLSRVDTLVAVATTGSGHAFAQVDSASVRLTRVLDRTDRLVASLDTTVRTSGPGLVTTQQEALRTVRELHDVVADLHDALAQEGGTASIVHDLARTADNLARLTDRLERDPTSILKHRAAVTKTAGPGTRD